MIKTSDSPPADRQTPVHYRRSPHLVAHWQEGGVRLLNLSTDRTLEASAEVIQVLECCSDWASADDIALRLPHSSKADIEQGLLSLADATMVVRIGESKPERDRVLRDWDDWAPAATHFHLATRNVPFAAADELGSPAFTLRSKPNAIKSYGNTPTIPLPEFSQVGEVAQVLLARRTWRRFGQDPLPLDALGTLCGLTWAVQSWAVFDGVASQPLKTSPSGGARHSIEAYICSMRVDGLPNGIYHYGPDSHALTRVRAELTPKDIQAFLPAQGWYTGAAVVVFMTSVFGRVQWRYPHPRAYRNVYIEAGHLAQTFCLLATKLGLAPFCTAAISEDAVEPALGIDGVSEGVVYAVGAGVRPENVGWAPLPDADLLPTLVDPAYMTHRRNPETGVE